MVYEFRVEQCFTSVNPSEIFITREIDACLSESETRPAKLKGWPAVSKFTGAKQIGTD